LGAEGDAISFACERYAMGLPDIEAYIDQKIPSEPVTEDLLVALPRKPREGVEKEAAEGESVSEIFREAREQRAAEDARRGGPRKSSSGGRGRGGGRGAGGEGRGERGPRPPRRRKQDTGDAAAQGQPQAARAAAAPVAAGDEPARPPRKRRRRRRGRSIEGGEAGQQQGGGQQAGGANGANGAAARPPSGPREIKARPVRATDKPAAQPASTAKDKSSSLISRIGSGLKKLVTRAPRTQH